MARLFQPRADTALRVAFVAIAAIAFLVVVGPFIYVRTPYARNTEMPLDQPVQFDHRHHVRDDGIDCLYCHEGARRTPYAGVPATEVCMGCHSQVWNESPM